MTQSTTYMGQCAHGGGDVVATPQRRTREVYSGLPAREVCSGSLQDLTLQDPRAHPETQARTQGSTKPGAQEHREMFKIPLCRGPRVGVTLGWGKGRCHPFALQAPSTRKCRHIWSNKTGNATLKGNVGDSGITSRLPEKHCTSAKLTPLPYYAPKEGWGKERRRPTHVGLCNAGG